MQERKQVFFINTLLILTSILTFFAVGEVCIRVKYSLFPPPLELKEAFRKKTSKKISKSIFIEDKNSMYRLRPNVNTIRKGARVKINSHGLRRSSDIQTEKGFQTYRIVVLGDSIVFGNKLEEDETFSYLLEKKMNKAGNGAFVYEVLNCGVPAFSNSQELALFKSHLLELKPDLVIIGFCLNDFLAHVKTIVAGEKLVFKELTLKDIKAVKNIWHYILTPLRVLNEGLLNNSITKHSMFSKWLYDEVRLAVNIVDVAFNYRFPWDMLPNDYLAWRDEPYTEIKKNLAEFKALSEKHSFRLLLTVFPYRDQLKEKYRQIDLNRVLKPQIKLKKISEDLGIPFLSYYEPFFEYMTKNKGDILYFEQIHPNALGNALIAQELYKYIRRSHNFRVEN